MRHRVQRIDGDRVAAEPVPNDRRLVGAVRESWPKIDEHERADSPGADRYDGEPTEPAPPRGDLPVDDPREDSQDGDRDGISVFQNQPVHLITLSWHPTDRRHVVLAVEDRTAGQIRAQ